ncbi:MAG: BamA/TamA family outer membrane protein [Bacteroidota bacterium]|nr:BamA/TamA family outer membrane protein [Bacteroidota bacterium]
MPQFCFTQTPQKAEVNDLDVIVGENISEYEIVSQLATMETPWTIEIFLNEHIYRGIGSPRAYYDPNIFYQDIIHLYTYLKDNGYILAKIDTLISYSSDKKYVNLTIGITENARSFIDTVHIVGLEEIDADVRNDILGKNLLKHGDPFTKKLLTEEQSRIKKQLVNSGYSEAFLDSSASVRYASTNNISVLLKFNAGKRYVFGNTTFDHVDDRIDSSVMLRQMDFQEGEIYNEEKRMESEQNLNRLGIFEFASVRHNFLASQNDSNKNVIPLIISFRTLELQEITPEFLLENTQYSFITIGLGLSYKHHNLFGGAQNFSFSPRIRANSFEELNFPGAFSKGLSEPTLFGKADVQSQIVFPYFLNNKTSASITLSAEAEKQRDYDLTTLRAKLGFITKLSTYTVGITDLNIERVDPFYKKIDASGIRPEDSTKQFNFIESYTLQRDKTNNIFSPTAGFFHSGTIEEGGVISKIADGFGLPFSEYIKLSILLKHFFSSEYLPSQVFALKFNTGMAKLYNLKNTTPVPLPRRFFAGGSSSVRGWKDKQLSALPGSNIGGNFALEGSFESRTQLSPNGGKIFNVLEIPRFWLVTFLDYGNTWNKVSDVMVSEIALAVGVGLRYETFVGPIRADLAWRLYDPKEQNGRQWLYEQQFFTNSFSIVHIGIGHAF